MGVEKFRWLWNVEGGADVHLNNTLLFSLLAVISVWIVIGLALLPHIHSAAETFIVASILLTCGVMEYFLISSLDGYFWTAGVFALLGVPLRSMNIIFAAVLFVTCALFIDLSRRMKGRG